MDYVIIALLIGIVFGWLGRIFHAKFQLTSLEVQAERLRQDASKIAEEIKREYMIEAKNELLDERNQQEKELRERRHEMQKKERRLANREESLSKKNQSLEEEMENLRKKQKKVENSYKDIENETIKLQHKWEEISGLTAQAARDMILSSLEEEVKKDSQLYLMKIEQEFAQTAENRAREIIVSCAQRMTSEINSEISISTVTLPNNEMKGRIIGKEGRNIRTLENFTGADIIIDDTPEAVLISCFDPIRKEIAKRSIEQLITDGRIHPARIEEIVEKVTNDIGHIIYEEGEKALFDLDIHTMHPEGIRAIGRLYFRGSYGQNVLRHSYEVALIAASIASELGADRDICKRAGILHDVGKSIITEKDFSHVELGVELAKRLNEDPKVINAIAAHHGDTPHSCIESIIVQIADSLSAGRPGARRESADNFLRRIENLENIAESFTGVEKAFAIQAGRELRVIINHEELTEYLVPETAKNIAKRIEEEMSYPGRIKITMIREMRIIEYAR